MHSFKRHFCLLRPNKYIYAVVLIVLSLSLFSQTSDIVQTKIDSLETLKSLLLNKVNTIEKEIDSMTIIKNELWINEQAYQVYIFKKDGFLYDKEGRNSEEIKVTEGTKVLFVNDLDDFFLVVSYNGEVYTAKKRWVVLLSTFHRDKFIADSLQVVSESIKHLADSMAIANAKPYVFTVKGGIYKNSEDWEPFTKVDIGTEVFYVKDIYPKGYSNCMIIYKGEKCYADNSILVSKKEYQDILKNHELKKLELLEYRQSIIDTYGEDTAKKIFEHKIWIGMTKLMLIRSRGYPIDINRTVTGNNIREQWVYGNKLYVYFDNDIVTAWQD